MKEASYSCIPLVFITESYRKNIINTIINILYIFAVIVLAWIAVSTIEVISNNLDPNPTYAVWNIYNLIG